jgi:hypothetical protein
MLLAVRLVDLGTLITMGALWVALGAFVFVLYAWLWRTGGISEASAEAPSEPPVDRLPEQAPELPRAA